MIKIADHKIGGATFQQTPNVGNVFAKGLPDTLVIHFTGGRNAESSAKWLCDPQAKASAHVIIGKDGNIIQLADLNMVTWHAGRSKWNGRSQLNAYSIGIELDNAGELEDRIDGYYTWFKTKVADNEVVKATHRNQSTPSYWQTFTEKQITVTQELCEAILDTYPEINTIVGHEEISPGRKTDPGPAFPLDKLRNHLLGRKDTPDAPESPSTQKATQKGMVSASKLNIRSAPSGTASKVAPPLEMGTIVSIIDEQGNWYKVKMEMEGWVSKDYIRH